MSDEDAYMALASDHAALVDAFREAVAERDRLRAVVAEHEHALEHVAVCPVSCPECRKVAQSALDHENLSDFIDQLDVSPTMGGTGSTEGAPHESDGGGRISSRGAPDPPNGGPVPPSTPAPQPGPSVGDRATCRWCDQPITFTSSSELAVDEDSWTHDWPQPGSGYVRRRKCEADMQSMLAEPTGTET